MKFRVISVFLFAIGVVLGASERGEGSGGSSYRVLVLGDLHFDSEEFHRAPPASVNKRKERERNLRMWKARSPRLLETASGRAKAEKAVFAVQLGDLVQGDCDDRDLQRAMIVRGFGMLKGYFNALPLVIVKGNHDIRTVKKHKDNAVADSTLMPLVAGELGIPTPANGNYAFTQGQDLFIGIDGFLPAGEPPDSGRFIVGETVRFGYFSQEGMQFDQEMKVIDAVRRVAEYVDLGGGRHLTAMQFLQHFLFTPLQQQNYIYKLSGGERRRLYLCTVLMQNPNFLILDEPTNDLDIVTLNILEDYLKNFRGCVIVVSHDRYFMDKVVDHLLVFQGDGIVKDFPGNYTQFREWEKENTASGKPTSNASPKGGNSAVQANPNVDNRVGQPRPRRLTFKERREMETLEAEIASLEAEKTALETALCSGTLSVAELTEKSKRLPLLAQELEDKEMRWLELSEIEG